MAPKVSSATYQATTAALLLYSVAAGYYAGTKGGTAAWTYFSWHPFLMTVGMVGVVGAGAMTKKLGGYTNTKLHGMIAWTGYFLSLGGFYIIYSNKNNFGRPHFTSNHATGGALVLVMMFCLGAAGGTFLHPDFGIDKNNKTIRAGHKLASRCCVGLAWMTAFAGLQQMMPHNTVALAMYGVPLLCLAPVVLL